MGLFKHRKSRFPKEQSPKEAKDDFRTPERQDSAMEGYELMELPSHPGDKESPQLKELRRLLSKHEDATARADIQAATAPSPFFRLPSKVRRQVYLHVISLYPEDIHVAPNNVPRLPSLLGVSRQIRREATPHYHRVTNFHFEILDFNASNLTAWLQRNPQANIRLKVYDTKLTPDVWENLVAWLKAYWEWGCVGLSCDERFFAKGFMEVEGIALARRMFRVVGTLKKKDKRPEWQDVLGVLKGMRSDARRLWG